jgi:hypothetical protein
VYQSIAEIGHDAQFFAQSSEQHDFFWQKIVGDERMDKLRDIDAAASQYRQPIDHDFIPFSNRFARVRCAPDCSAS